MTSTWLHDVFRLNQLLYAVWEFYTDRIDILALSSVHRSWRDHLSSFARAEGTANGRTRRQKKYLKVYHSAAVPPIASSIVSAHHCFLSTHIPYLEFNLAFMHEDITSKIGSRILPLLTGLTCVGIYRDVSDYANSNLTPWIASACKIEELHAFQIRPHNLRYHQNLEHLHTVHFYFYQGDVPNYLHYLEKRFYALKAFTRLQTLHVHQDHLRSTTTFYFPRFLRLCGSEIKTFYWHIKEFDHYSVDLVHSLLDTTKTQIKCDQRVYFNVAGNMHTIINNVICCDCEQDT